MSIPLLPEVVPEIDANTENAANLLLLVGTKS